VGIGEAVIVGAGVSVGGIVAVFVGAGSVLVSVGEGLRVTGVPGEQADKKNKTPTRICNFFIESLRGDD
jgi:serine acetyltransferase